MPQFAVFLAEAQACAIHPVRAMDAAHAVDIVRAQHPDAHRLAVITAEHLDGVNRMELLAEWCAARG